MEDYVDEEEEGGKEGGGGLFWRSIEYRVGGFGGFG